MGEVLVDVDGDWFDQTFQEDIMEECEKEEIIPTDRDVLFGRGAAFYNRFGNHLFQAQVQDLQSEYRALR